jgi:hypothetical protein
VREAGRAPQQPPSEQRGSLPAVQFDYPPRRRLTPWSHRVIALVAVSLSSLRRFVASTLHDGPARDRAPLLIALCVTARAGCCKSNVSRQGIHCCVKRVSMLALLSPTRATHFNQLEPPRLLIHRTRLALAAAPGFNSPSSELRNPNSSCKQL